MQVIRLADVFVHVVKLCIRQAQILRLIRELHAETDSALLLITHDLGVIAGTCKRMLVLDEGRLVEEGSTRDLFSRLVDDCTKRLLSAAPSIGSKVLAKPLPAGAGPVLSVDGLAVSFRGGLARRGDHLRAVRPLSFSLQDGERLRLRVFVDKSVVEVYANDRQCAAREACR